MTSLFPILLLALIVTAFGCLLLFIASRLGPKVKKDPVKLMSYECGLPGQESKDTKISIKFYLTAILFIIFDIEIIFMYPWAIAFVDFVKQGQGGYILGAMGLFIFLFVVGLFWEVKSKALEWE